MPRFLYQSLNHYEAFLAITPACSVLYHRIPVWNCSGLCALLEGSYCRRLRLPRMRTKPHSDQNQLRHTATEAQQHNIDDEAGGIYDLSS